MCSWFLYRYLNFRVEQEGQSSVPQTPGSLWGSLCCSPPPSQNTFLGLTKQREVRNAVVNATLIENLAISIGSSHTNPNHCSLCPVNAGQCNNHKQDRQYTRNVTSRRIRATTVAVESNRYYILWMCVALAVQHIMCMHHIVACSLPCSAIFFHIIS
jgi:hypothetical protein